MRQLTTSWLRSAKTSSHCPSKTRTTRFLQKEKIQLFKWWTSSNRFCTSAKTHSSNFAWLPFLFGRYPNLCMTRSTLGWQDLFKWSGRNWDDSTLRGIDSRMSNSKRWWTWSITRATSTILSSWASVSHRGHLMRLCNSWLIFSINTSTLEVPDLITAIWSGLRAYSRSLGLQVASLTDAREYSILYTSKEKE